MKEIFTRNGVAIQVDDEDYSRLCDRKWAIHSHGYAYNSTIGYMHRLVMNAIDNLHVDHINHNKLDNQKHNLRLCTNKENSKNRKGANSNSKSGHIGVSWSKSNKKWQSAIMVDNKQIHLGHFDSIEDAIYAREIAKLKYH